jgi:Flp pilus assembly pilin Flp
VKRIMIWSMTLVDWAQRKFTGRGDVGASLVEYALLLALIAVVAIGALVFLGHSVNNQLNNVANVINTNATTPTT